MPEPSVSELLRDAIDAARAALRDMESDEIPARVRRVAASSERKLPPPLATSLLRELGSNEFLRAKALEAWEGDPPERGPESASRAFLERSPGWETTVLVEALAMGERWGAAADRTSERQRKSLAAEVSSLKEQVRRVRAEASRREGELVTQLDAERAPLREARTREQRALARLEEERSSWAARQAQLEARLAASQEEIRQLKEVARAERRARSEVAAQLESGGVGGLPSDPMELARLIDDIAAHAMALAPTTVPSRDSSVPGSDGPALDFDRSLRPDRAEAIDWLVSTDRASVLIDGYNLGFEITGELDATRARALAVEAASRLATSAPEGGVTVVFDSSREPVDDVADAAHQLGNLAIEFTAGESADDAIVRRVGSGARVVVITNDRDLRHRVETGGGVAIWSDALVEWSRRR